MLKPYKVLAYSELMNAEMRCVSIEQAEEIYEMMMNTDCYHSGDITNNFTGEVYAYFVKEVDSNGIKLTTWSALK